MLGIALGAIDIACLLMIVLFSKYSFSTKGSGIMAPSQAATLTQAFGTWNSGLSCGFAALGSDHVDLYR
jgi:hypothetical protein